MKIAWETLHNVTKHDLGLALITGKIQIDTVCVAVKRRIEDLEKLNVETPGTKLAFSVLRGARSEHDKHINVKERSVAGNFNLKLIELGNKCEKLEDEMPTEIINAHKENGHNVDGTTCEEDGIDNGKEAMEQLNKFQNQN